MRFILVIILMFTSVSAIMAEDAKGVRLPSIFHLWGEDSNKNRAPITIEEISRCMGKEDNVTKEYEAFEKESADFKTGGEQFESLSKTIEQERAGLTAELKKVNDKLDALNQNSKNLEFRKTEINTLAKLKLDSKQAKEANNKISNYNQDVKLQNEAAKNANFETEKYYEKQNAFNERLRLTKQELDAYNEKASVFDQRRAEFNQRLLVYKDKCSGERRLVK